jgi:hypothetical protein
MLRQLALLASIATLFTTAIRAEEPMNAAQLEGKHDCYEMRTYTAAPGKLEALHARFREHTNMLFLKHGMTLIGYWTPAPLDKPKEGEVDRSQNTLVYILAYPDRESREKMWKAFQSDPEWKKAREESEVQGKLVEKVESVFMTPTDFSPIK